MILRILKMISFAYGNILISVNGLKKTIEVHVEKCSKVENIKANKTILKVFNCIFYRIWFEKEYLLENISKDFFKEFFGIV